MEDLHMRLFKSTLVACAAFLAFSCTNDLDDNGHSSADKGFLMTINASQGEVTDETRTAIRLDQEGNKRVVWNGNDAISIVEVADGNIESDNTPGWQIKDRSDEKVAVFSTRFRSERIPGTNYNYFACYPYSNGNRFTFENSGKAHMTMPATQVVPEGEKGNIYVDPAAMLLVASDTGHDGRPYQIDLRFDHAAAYVKLNFKDIALGQNEKIAKIILSAGHEGEDNENNSSATAEDDGVYLAGSCVYDFDGEGTTLPDTGLNSAPSKSVTLDISTLGYGASTTKVEGTNLYAVPEFTVYMATLPATLKKFSITIVTTITNKHYVKNSSDNAPELTLTRGKIRTINVSNNGFKAEQVTIYRKAKSVEELAGKECVITSDGGATYTMANNKTNTNLIPINIYDAGFGENIYEFDPEIGYEDVLLNKDASEYTWSIRNNGDDVYTIHPTQSDNLSLAVGNSARLTITDKEDAQNKWTISYDEANDEFFIYSTSIENSYIQTQRDQYWVADRGWSKVHVYYKTDDKMDSNSAVPEREEEDVEPAKYYKKVTAPENGKNYVIAAEVQIDGKTVYYTFNNYFNLKKDAERTPKLLLASDAANGEYNAGFVPAVIEGFNDGDVYTSTRGSYYTWNANIIMNCILYSTDAGITNFRLTNNNTTAALMNTGSAGLTFTADGDGVNISNNNNSNTRYLSLRVNNDSAMSWGFFNDTKTKLYLFEESDTAPEPPVEEKGDVYKKVETPSANKEYIITTTSGSDVYAMTRSTTDNGYVLATNLSTDANFTIEGNEIRTLSTNCTFKFDGTSIYFLGGMLGTSYYYLRSLTVATNGNRQLLAGTSTGTKLALTNYNGYWYHTFSSNVYSYIYLNGNQWYVGHNTRTSILTFWEKQ